MAAAQAGASELTLIGRLLTCDHDRASIRTDSIRPGHLRISSRFQDLAIRAIERIEKAISIGLDESLDLAAIDSEVHR